MRRRAVLVRVLAARSRPVIPPWAGAGGRTRAQLDQIWFVALTAPNIRRGALQLLASGEREAGWSHIASHAGVVESIKRR